MPNLNQKGPMGQGAMSGRKMGKCTNFGKKGHPVTTNEQQPNENIPVNGAGRGKGMGRGQGGMGMGMGRRFQNGKTN